MSRLKNYSYLIVHRKVLKPILFELKSSCCIFFTGPVFFMLVDVLTPKILYSRTKSLILFLSVQCTLFNVYTYYPTI